MRAVLDPNVLVSALLSRTGAPAALLAHWLAGGFELVVSELLLAEVERALGYSKVRARVESREASEFVSLLRNAAVLAPDPVARPRRSRDPGDDYLIALAEAQHAVLVTGDQHLLDLADRFPIRTTREYLGAIENRGPD